MSGYVIPNVPGGPVYCKALWNWNVSTFPPTVTTYSNGTTTKTGLQPIDVRTFCGVPIQRFGNPPIPTSDAQILAWIRAAEDYVEQETSILLCPTWVASPPSINPLASNQIGLITVQENGVQRLGYDYDLADSGYDFIYDRAKDDGWMVQQLRYRPLRNVTLTDITAIKAMSFVYPLLSNYFRINPSWYVEEQDFSSVRIVPAANVQMLPLFALQLAIGGFSDIVPGGLAVQYTAGLTAYDYQTRFNYIQQLVLAQACIYALSSIQGSVNMGLEKHQTLVDGVQYMAQYNTKGPFAPLIATYTNMRDELLSNAYEQVAGPMFVMLGS